MFRFSRGSYFSSHSNTIRLYYFFYVNLITMLIYEQISEIVNYSCSRSEFRAASRSGISQNMISPLLPTETTVL
jgi:hypothetical protein